MINIIESDKFKDEIKNGVVVVDFFATWCSPCKMLSPILEELQEELKDEVKIIKVDVDSSADLASEYDISSIPALMILKDGEKKDSLIGFSPKEIIKEKIKNNL